jgi:glyoxylase-like metal-dependent hydrolase (beta-lactamase superfamily II)
MSPRAILHEHVISHPWSEPPPPGGVLAVAPGVKWLRMPLPFKLDHINLWLLEDAAGVTVVDTGIGLPDVRALWERVLEVGLGGRPVRRVVVTHFHPDHMGNADWLARRFGVDVWCTQAEWLMAQLVSHGGGDPERRVAHYQRHGVDADSLERVRRRGNPYVQGVPSVAPSFRCLRDGDVLEAGGHRWRVMTVFGHSPEQAVLHAADAGVLISGDQVLPKITTNVSVWPDQPFGDPLRLYLDSLERFRPLPASTLVLPSHGLPFRGLPERLAALARHHQERLETTLAALAEPRTAAELMPVLFDRELDTHQLNFAIGETLAHVHHLEAQGRVTRRLGDDQVYRFQRR